MRIITLGCKAGKFKLLSREGISNVGAELLAKTTKMELICTSGLAVIRMLQDATIRSPTIADKTGTLVFPLPQQKNEDVAENAVERSEEPAQPAFGQSASGGSEAENTEGLPGLLGECADPLNMSKMSLTGMMNTGVMFAEETTGERHTIEGNCCMALAQSALKDGRYLCKAPFHPSTPTSDVFTFMHS